MSRPELQIHCDVALSSGGAETLLLDIDGVRRGATLHIEKLTKALVADLPPRALDLVEIAAFVYAADSAITRGSASDPHLGARWRRRLILSLPVRDAAFWSADQVRKVLGALLRFLSDDDYAFEFRERKDDGPPGYFDFGPETGFHADEVLMFSGGLDSFAGALEEIVSHKNRVALVSHWSPTKLQHAQKALVDAFSMTHGPSAFVHVPIWLHMKKGDLREATHRARSFFFAAIGIVVARMFGKNRARFYENGVVSLNLPPSGQAVGARATRSTHPKALAGFGDLFRLVFDADARIDNPFFWKTKTDVVELIRALGATALIPLTRSCADDVRSMTRQHPHCGRCSQCTDRRIAMLAAGLENDDQILDYAIDPVFGPREKVEDRELAVGYVDNARRFAAMTPGDFLRSFGEVQRVLGCFDEPPDLVAERILELHRRHGAAVLRGLDRAGIGDQPANADSLAALVGPTGADAALPPGSLPARPPRPREHRTMTIGPRKHQVTISGLGAFSGATADLLIALAEPHLMAAGEGLRPEEHPTTRAPKLATMFSITEPSLRRRIHRARRVFEKAASLAGDPEGHSAEIIENIPSRGYRLDPDIRVIRATKAGAPPA